MRISIYGGAFDPFTRGHLLAILDFFATDLVDCVWINPSGERRHDKNYKVSFEHRYQMIKLCVTDFAKSQPYYANKIKVVDFEKNGFIPTARLFKKLYEKDIERNIQNTYFCVIGNDLIYSIPSWRDQEIIDIYVNFLILNRVPYEARTECTTVISEPNLRESSSHSLSSNFNMSGSFSNSNKLFTSRHLSLPKIEIPVDNDVDCKLEKILIPAFNGAEITSNPKNIINSDEEIGVYYGENFNELLRNHVCICDYSDLKFPKRRICVECYLRDAKNLSLVATNISSSEARNRINLAWSQNTKIDSFYKYLTVFLNKPVVDYIHRLGLYKWSQE